jgi:hypothetical protein
MFIFSVSRAMLVLGEARFAGMVAFLGGCSTLVRAMALRQAWLVEWKGERLSMNEWYGHVG